MQTPSSPARPSLRRAYWRATLAYALAWALGIGTLTTLALRSSAQLRTRDMLAELRVVSTAIYGLSYYDRSGAYQTRLLELEPDLFPDGIEAYVLEPGRDTPLFATTARPRLSVPGLPELVALVVATEAEVVRGAETLSGQPFTLLARPTYDTQDRVRAAVVVVGDTASDQHAHRRFTVILVGGGVVLFGVGTLFALWMGRRSVAPLVQSYGEREHFIAAAAHELRTPVAALRAEIESALAQDEPAEAPLRRMRSLIDQASAKVETVLTRARLNMPGSAIDLEPTRLDLLVESRLRPGVHAPELDEVIVGADADLLAVALDNLLANAMSHGNAENVTVRVIRPGELLVEDEGPGFESPGDAPRAFGVRSPGGVGLGLSLVRRIVELHDAEMELENRPQGGARVRVRFPPA